MRGINISSILFLLIIVWNIAALIFFKIRKIKSKKTKNPGNGILITLIINVILLACLYYFSVNISVTHYNLKSERLPEEFDGYKILQISDFHTATFTGGTEALIKKVKKEKPDIVVLTGDLIDETRINLQPVIQLVTGLQAIAPVYSVSGNHDVWYSNFNEYQELLKNKGVILLENKKTILQRGNSSINLFGISDPETWNDLLAKNFLIENINKLEPDSGFNILLFHRANMFDIIKGKGYQLVFSGHMHGGQVQIPFVGGLVSPHQNQGWFPKYTGGRWENSGTAMIVSRGLGNNVPFPRLLNPPEVVVVTLRKK